MNINYADKSNNFSFTILCPTIYYRDARGQRVGVLLANSPTTVEGNEKISLFLQRKVSSGKLSVSDLL